jgi:hypothetical protein
MLKLLNSGATFWLVSFIYAAAVGVSFNIVYAGYVLITISIMWMNNIDIIHYKVLPQTSSTACSSKSKRFYVLDSDIGVRYGAEYRKP